MKIRLTKFATLALIAVAGSAFGSGITPGDIIVVQMGDGVAALSNSATISALKEYTPGGALVQTINLPTAASGSNRAFSNAGNATSEGFLTLSADGQFLIMGGYDATPGTATPATTASATINRVIARISVSTGLIDTTTALTDAYSAGNLRSGTSLDGSAFWMSGSVGGVRYATLGATTSTLVSSTITNSRVVNIANGQLYVTSGSASFLGISSVGTGTPTTTGQTSTLLPGFSAVPSLSNYDFWFANPTTIYVADDRAVASSGGLEKWMFDSGTSTWQLKYTLNAGLTAGLRGITGNLSGNNATLFATSSDSKMETIIDDVTVTTLPGASTFTQVGSTAPTNTAFRGIEMVPAPEPASMAVLALGALGLLRRRKKA